MGRRQPIPFLMDTSTVAQQAHVVGGTGALDQATVGGNQRTIEHLGEGDVGGVVVREPAKRMFPTP